MKLDPRRPTLSIRECLETLRDWFHYGNIALVSMVPVLLGLCLLGVAIPRMDLSWPRQGADLLPTLLAAGALAVMGMSGAVQAWRREVPAPLGGTLHGAIAMVLGWLWAIAFWAAAVLFLLL